MLERHETIAFALPRVLVQNYNGLLELAVGREEASQALGGGVPAEAADEELALRGVGICDQSDGIENVGVAGDGVQEHVDELIGGEALDDFPGVFAIELGDGEVGVQNDAVLVQLSLLGWVHWGEKEKKINPNPNP